ncbi:MULTISPECIES: hypothetical protein [unclassified Pseudoalteromonas]|uniref:hypothetical protein n=1 Tax=unclassified Pseudoalteromonas TaxID=194690 RepID=UPI0025B5A620|nr:MULTISPECIES: hypothetical protein [unclassified Pseudoalteromonas]MDN3379967.1 hypothetical protein [Pseudoalteromonas sp. APC 3893]MDN3388306.1 hypothetical protein [Pseudoalteromonas sp. APC 4017]
MAKWCWPLIISVIIHVIIFTVLINRKTATMPSAQKAAMKVYVVSMPNQVEPASKLAETTVKKQSSPAIAASISANKQPLKNKVKIKATAPKQKTINTAKEFKKIDLNKGLKNIKMQYQDSYSSSHLTSLNPKAPDRISVPEDHVKPGQPILKIEQQNMQFTTYRIGDKCFKKVFIGGGSMPQNDLPDSYITGSKDCPKTKITQAYDIAMDKWLNKK